MRIFIAPGRVRRRGVEEMGAGRLVLARLGEVPGGAALLELAGRGEELELAGGAVRDLLLGEDPRELDVVTAGDAIEPARTLAQMLRGTVTAHARFGTAVVRAGAARVDLARRRAESYPAPGALPEVRAGDPAEDLARRDFTVNAIAVALGGERPGALRAAPHALEDLREGVLRVLHERSFIDDPTRLWRLARYAARLRFAIEPHTARLAGEALGDGALGTVSGARLGAELRLALGESQPAAALAALEELGVLGALHPRLRFEPRLFSDALELLPAADGRPDLLALAALALPLTLRADGRRDGELAALLDRLEFQAHDRDRTVAAALAASELAERLARARVPSELRDAAGRVPPEGVALAGALGGSGPGTPAAAGARRWLEHARHVRLQITGEDLLRAGVPEGPEVGARLDVALRRRLDGALGEGAQAELAAALEPLP